MKTLIGDLKVKGAEPVFFNEKIPSLILKDNAYKANFAQFIECEFEEYFQLQNINLSNGLVFLDCTFNHGALLNAIVVDKYNHLLQSDSVSIIFNNCVFDEKVSFIGKSELERALVFENCTFKKGLEIYFLNIKIESLRIKDCTVFAKLDVFNSHFKQGISISNNTINTYLRLEHIHGSSISFTSDNVVKDQLRVDDCQLENGIVFNNGTFKDDVNFSVNITRSSGLTIHGSVFEKSFVIYYHHHKTQPVNGISKYYLSDCKFQSGIYIKGNQNYASANSPSVSEITIIFTPKLMGSIVFSDLDVGIINLSGFNANANIGFKNIYVNEFFVKSFTNNSGLILSSVNSSFVEWVEQEDNSKIISSLFIIDDSNLGKAQIYSVDFNSFDSVVIGNTTLVDIATSMINWFADEKLNAETLATAYRRIELSRSKSKELSSSATQNLIHWLSIKKEVYRQIKVVAQKQGDIPLSLSFQRNEMRYYREIIKLEKNRFDPERLILSSNYYSNDFGQDWFKAFKLLLGFSFLFYIPIGFLTSDILDYSKFASSWSDVLLNLRVVFCDNIREWFITLNPTHRIKDFTDNIEKYSAWVYFWDLLSRIIVSYFIFQMIYAFRKFNK